MPQKINEENISIVWDAIQASEKPMVVAEIHRVTGLGVKLIIKAKNHLIKRGKVHQFPREKSGPVPIFKGPMPEDKLPPKPPKQERYIPKPQPFFGISWNPPVQRPGCQDFLNHPSRRGDDRVEYRPPVHECVGALVDKRSLVRD